MAGDKMPKSWENQRVSKLSPEEQGYEMRDTIRRLEDRASILEQRVEHLRTSRRVLMILLEKIEVEKGSEIHRLEKLLELERSQKKRVPKDHLLWVIQKHPSLDDLANEHLVSYPNEPQAVLEAQGIRENAKSIREEFKSDESEVLDSKQDKLRKIRRLTEQKRV